MYYFDIRILFNYICGFNLYKMGYTIKLPDGIIYNNCEKVFIYDPFTFNPIITIYNRENNYFVRHRIFPSIHDITNMTISINRKTNQQDKNGLNIAIMYNI